MNTTIKLTDDQDSLKLGYATVEVSVQYVVHPGDPGCRYTANGDGWPPSPPEVEVSDWIVSRVSSGDGTPIDWRADLGVLSRLIVWVSKQLEDERETIDCELLSFAEDIE
jgi:hypothetical protein